MTVGILIPTYNRREFLAQALASVVGQSYANLAVIVIDNGSTDGTAEYMASVNDPRVRYVVNDRNLGLIGSINRGIGLMPTEVTWCTILCDDDLLDSGFVRALVATVGSTGALSIVHSHRVFIDGAGGLIRDAEMSPAEESALEFLRLRAKAVRETYLTGVMFSRAAFGEIGGYPAFSTGLASDDAFIFALALKDRLVFDGNARARIRIHEGAESLTSHDAIRKLRTVMEFLEYCGRRAGERRGLDSQGVNGLETVLKGYARSLNGYWWLAGIHAAYDRQQPESGELVELGRFAREHAAFLTPRVRLGIACQRLTGIMPERFKAYQALWTGVKKLCRMMGNSGRAHLPAEGQRRNR